MSGSKLAYQYVVLRCVPRVDREEFLNVGVVVYCEAAGYLEAAWQVDRDRLAALAPGLDVDQVCEASGGPCKYTGRSMKAAHAGMRITDAEFNALVEDLVKSLDKFKVPAKEKNELLGVSRFTVYNYLNREKGV